MFQLFRIRTVVMVMLLMLLAAIVQIPVAAQDATPLRVQEAVTGELTAQASTALYAFNVAESKRMGFYADRLSGDMDITLIVFDQDGKTLLGGANGSHSGGVIVSFDKEGQYFLALQGANGSSAQYRLMIDAGPALPINTFVVQSYLAAGTSAKCAEDTPTTYFKPDADMNVCFTLALIDQPVEVAAQWWSPNGELVSEEKATFDNSLNFVASLTGLIYDGKTPFSEGWWQIHILINGELAHIQWAFVAS